jgi:Tol biopolymer transport system component
MSSAVRQTCLVLFGLLLVGVVSAPADAQYFGQNKVQYDKFDFRVLETEHFDIHYYPAEEQAARMVARMAERWHARLTKVLAHELTGRQAVVLYASHPEFEQTNVIEGMIDEATGGVTEGMRRRVVLPLAASLGDTDHVLGHELVHAYQYDILGQRAGPAPLWFIEGMAEYLSMGPRSALTAMWLRDAAIEGHLPKVQDLDSPEYFPYRFGHAFWAYIGGRYGDEMVGTLLQRMALAGQTGGANPSSLLEETIGMKPDVLSEEWHASIYKAYGLQPRQPADENVKSEVEQLPPGQVVIGERTGESSLNVGPALSPDGTKIAFLSARSRLSVDLYVADAKTGKILRSLTKSASDPHFQSLQFISSSGTWSPDSKRLAVATVRAGRPVLALFDVDSGDITQEIPLGQPGEILQPSWSPNGQAIAFSAQVGGFTDLYVYDLAGSRLDRITDDQFADLQPTWSPDGRAIVFISDRFSSNLDTLEFGDYNLARVDPTSRTVARLNTGLRGNEYNPQWGTDDNTLFVVSDMTGRPEIHRVDLNASSQVLVTAEQTGVSGITPLSPALSVSRQSGRAAVNVFRDRGYELRVLEVHEIAMAEATPSATIDFAALPPVDRKPSVVAQALDQPSAGLPPAQEFPTKGYKPKLSLLAVGQQVGVSSGGAFGTYVAGGIAMLFGDTLGEHLISAAADVNGRVRDIGAQLAYYNRQNRWNWGVSVERVPLLSGTVQAGFATIDNQLVYVEQALLDRQTYSQVGGTVAYPLSRATRFEVSLAGEHIGFSREIESRIFDPVTGQLLQIEREDVPGESSLTLARTGAALIHDTATFGATSPVLGRRMRLEAAPTFGQLSLTDVTGDIRQYYMPVRPVTLAMRFMHIGRYGSGSEDSRLFPLFLGYSTLVRGYDANSFEAGECTPAPDGSCPEFDRLIGSRIMVFNAELRAPAVGLFTGNLSYGAVPIELFTFFDSGVAWTKDLTPSFAGGSRDWISSAGFGTRINALGYLIFELNVTKPLNRPQKGWMFGFNLRPGF